MTKMMLAVTTVVAIAVLAPIARAADQTVGGTWMMSVDTLSLRMALTQTGKRVTGTLQNPHGNPIALTGEFERGRFRFFGSSIGGEWEYNVAGIGELKADGSLAGTLTSNVGDMTWAAKRR